MRICLRSLIESTEAWGSAQGEQVRECLQSLMASHPEVSLFAISLAGVERVDVSFARAALVELARCERRRRGFCLVDASDPDMIENWDAAARRGAQPLLAWDGATQYCILGPQPSAGLSAMLHYVLSRPATRTNEAAAALQLRIPNASNKLKQLWQEGYILRQEQCATSGGVEYAYLRIACARALYREAAPYGR